MAINTLESIFTKDNGSSDEISCPVCSKNTEMRLFESVDTSIVAILQKDNKNMNIAVCPHCGSVFSVNPRYFEEKEKGTFVTMTESDLSLLVKGNG